MKNLHHALILLLALAILPVLGHAQAADVRDRKSVV